MKMKAEWSPDGGSRKAGLKWPCDGGCGVTIEEGVGRYVTVRITSSGPDEGEINRLCANCAERQLVMSKTGEKYRHPQTLD